MKKMLEHLVNVIYKEDSELLFGNGSKVEINSVSYSTNKKKYVINATAHVTNLDESLQVYPSGLDFILEESWKFIKYDNKPIIITSIKNR